MSENARAALGATARGVTDVFGVRLPTLLAGMYGPRGLRLLLNVACVLLVLSLPLTAAAAAARPSALPETTTLAAVAQIASADVAPRASTIARGIPAGSRDPATAIAEDARPITTYEVKRGDSLSSIANAHNISIDALAYANGIETEDQLLHAGQQLVIPPAEGAVYTVRDGDTPDSVAAKFDVKVDVIIGAYNLNFEPQNFAPGKQIFIPGATVPAIKRSETPRQIAIPLSPQQLPPMTGRLQWPVNGVITQYFWWGHTGVDIAAPYGTPIMSSLDGVVVATGWVAVGGLRVCVQGGDGFKVCDYHTSAIYVSVGQEVKRGQTIAAIGLTGVTTGPHVHWEVWLNGVQVNGLLY